MIFGDPGRQEKPAAWADLSFDELKQAVADHTTEVLSAIKARGIDVEWVQVGNETRTGMLKPDGAASSGKTANFAQLVTAGYDAVKTIYPEAKVIVLRKTRRRAPREGCPGGKQKYKKCNKQRSDHHEKGRY